MSVTRRGAGCGGFVRGRRPHARHRFKPSHAEAVRPGRRWSLPPVVLEQTCKAPRAERRNLSAVRGDYARALFPKSRMRLRAFESPAFRAPFSRAGM
jgi:hypothetical protein